jgi:hypothetical protein
MITLEQEFENFKALHKYAIMKVKLVRYFQDLEEGTIQLPDFLRPNDTPEKKADKAIRELVSAPDGGKRFNELYEQAYQELSEVLD